MEPAPLQSPPHAAPPARSRLKTALILGGGAVAAGLLAGGIVILIVREPAAPPAPPANAGFDVAVLPQSQMPAGSAALPKPATSGLDMVQRLGLPGPATAAAPASPLEQAAEGFRSAIRESEKTLGDLAREYTAKYPVIRQYGRDWMSYPDLKKLNDDYMRDHDPIAFLRGLASSPSFPKLMSKYGGSREIHGFVQECLTKAPSGAVASSMDYISRDKTLDTFVQNVAGQAGVPPALLAGEALQNLNLPAQAPPPDNGR